MSDTADVRAAVTALCKAAGVDKKQVKSISIDNTAGSATFELYAVDEKGNQFLSPQTNEAAMADSVTVDIRA